MGARAGPRAGTGPHRAAMTTTHTSPPPVCDHPSHGAVRHRNGDLPLVMSKAMEGPCRLLIDEWESMVTRRTLLRKVNGWNLVQEDFDNLDDVLVTCGFGLAFNDDHGDHLLWHLVRIAADDELAARIVLQRIMPPLMSVAQRRGRILPGGVTAAIDEIMAVAWETIRTFPHERRTRKIAANLVLDSQYNAFVRPVRMRKVEELPTAFGHTIARPNEEEHIVTDLELAMVLKEAEDGGADPAKVELLREFGRGRTSEEIGAEQGWSARTIRNRRVDALEEVRRVVLME